MACFDCWTYRRTATPADFRLVADTAFFQPPYVKPWLARYVRPLCDTVQAKRVDVGRRTGLDSGIGNTAILRMVREGLTAAGYNSEAEKNLCLRGMRVESLRQVCVWNCWC